MATAVVAAAGTGERLGAGLPKALAPLAGRPLAAWSMEALASSPVIARVVIAAPPGSEEELRRLGRDAAPGLPVEAVAGGSSRSESVANALAAVGDDPVVVVHDAARPLVTADLVDRCVAELDRSGCAGAVAAVRATDTIKEADAGGHVIATLERERLWAIQTPQAFRTEVLRAALGGGPLERASDDAQLVEAAGGDVRIVEGSRENVKITTPLDMRLAELLLRER
jgi:2-C-methyl-D-erythritol 4-phosphate cytidylyltransferase